MRLVISKKKLIKLSHFLITIQLSYSLNMLERIVVILISIVQVINK